ncbi:MAG: ABC transporter ATP-binding protein [Clostridiales bacterium]|nr:ABC transporter ATP-binding protein [Clostridiales bacterium]
MNISEISVNNLSWSPDRRKLAVLKDISLTFTQGEIYGILGSNGAGKTSLIRHILGLIPHEPGAVCFDGIPASKFDKKELAQQIAFLPQKFAADIDFSVYDVVSMGREPYRGTFSTLTWCDKEIIDEAICITNCGGMEDKSLSTLSGGELQRVMIARTIAQDTPWIILDEPISSLDIKQQARFMQLMKRLNEEKGRTIIAILHDLNLAADYCSQLVFMKKGEIVTTGLTSEVLTPENLGRTFDVPFKFMEVEERKQPYVFPE